MAIKLPDPGNGIPEQKTGNDEWTNMKIVRDNFADQTHAASRLVGTATGNVMEVGAFGLGSTLKTTSDPLASLGDGFYSYRGANTQVPAEVRSSYMNTCIKVSGAVPDRYTCLWLPMADGTRFSISQHAPGYGVGLWTADIYHTRNTTKDVATGFLKASSPVLHVYNDDITKIHEAEQLDITVDKKGVGHYEIHGTTGLRKNDGWFMSPPRDLHGNVLCMIDVTEKDGVVILKTYKRKFDLELAAIVHDYDNPIDIPEGACVEFRFNDLPEEQLDEPVI